MIGTWSTVKGFVVVTVVAICYDDGWMVPITGVSLRMARELGQKLGQWNKERAAAGKPPATQ